MLKIAEYNTITGEKVELKELEKYGFEILYDEFTGRPEGIYVKSGFSFCEKLGMRNFIFFKKRTKSKLIIFKQVKNEFFGMDVSVPNNYRNRQIFLDKLYDLIKDGLVIKED